MWEEFKQLQQEEGQQHNQNHQQQKGLPAAAAVEAGCGLCWRGGRSRQPEQTARRRGQE